MEGGRRVEVPGPAAGTPTSQHPDSRDTPVLREPPLLEEVEEGAGTPLDTAVGGRDTTGTGASVRPAATTLGPVGDTVEDTAAVATAVIVTEPQPLLVATPPARVLVTAGPRVTATTPPPATPRPRPPAGQLAARASPDLAPGEAQSDPPPEIPDQTPTAEINDQSFIPSLGFL